MVSRKTLYKLVISYLTYLISYYFLPIIFIQNLLCSEFLITYFLNKLFSEMSNISPALLNTKLSPLLGVLNHGFMLEYSNILLKAFKNAYAKRLCFSCLGHCLILTFVLNSAGDASVLRCFFLFLFFLLKCLMLTLLQMASIPLFPPAFAHLHLPLYPPPLVFPLYNVSTCGITLITFCCKLFSSLISHLQHELLRGLGPYYLSFYSLHVHNKCLLS